TLSPTLNSLISVLLRVVEQVVKCPAYLIRDVLSTVIVHRPSPALDSSVWQSKRALERSVDRQRVRAVHVDHLRDKPLELWRVPLTTGDLTAILSLPRYQQVLQVGHLRRLALVPGLQALTHRSLPRLRRSVRSPGATSRPHTGRRCAHASTWCAWPGGRGGRRTTAGTPPSRRHAACSRSQTTHRTRSLRSRSPSARSGYPGRPAQFQPATAAPQPPRRFHRRPPPLPAQGHRPRGSGWAPPAPRPGPCASPVPAHPGAPGWCS